MYKGRVRRGTRPVCLMVTPCFSADCANAEHPSHESYARGCVVAFWRHMPTALRQERIAQETQRDLRVVDKVCWGDTKFEEQFANATTGQVERFLGVRDLYDKFEGKKDGWALALMEMLVDPMLYSWVPAWAVEQYERANPFFRRVLRRLVKQRLPTNKALLRRTR